MIDLTADSDDSDDFVARTSKRPKREHCDPTDNAEAASTEAEDPFAKFMFKKGRFSESKSSVAIMDYPHSVPNNSQSRAQQKKPANTSGKNKVTEEQCTKNDAQLFEVRCDSRNASQRR